MRRKGMSVIALAGVLVLMLSGTALAEEDARGTASTDLLGVELDVDTKSLGDVLTSLADESLVPASLDVLEVGTYASTDVTDRTDHSTPFASSGVVPLRIGDEEFGAVKAESTDGSESGSSAGATYGSVTDAASAIGASIAPLSVKASASAEQASAAVDTLVAEVAALLQTVDLDVEVSQLSSIVDQLSAASGASVEVTSLNVTLGDLLPADVLSQLPLGELLGLLESLGITAPDVQAQIDALRDALADLADGDEVAAVEAAGTALDETVAALQPVVDALDALYDELTRIINEIDSLQALSAAELVASAGGVVQVIEDLEQAVLDAEALGVEIPASCTSLPDTSTLDLTDATALLSALDAAETCALELRTNVQAALDALIADGSELDDAVDALVTAVDALIADLDTVTSLANALVDALDALLNGDALTTAAGTSLLSVEGVTIGISAIATDAVDTSSATVGCTPVTATVLGTSYTTPSCSEGLSAVQDVAATMNGAVSAVESILSGLPLTDVASVGDLKLELFGTLTESVAQDGDYVVSKAQIELLELVLPSLTVNLDPTSLGNLSLTDVLTPVETVLNGAISDIETLFAGTTVDTSVLTGAIDTALNEVTTAYNTALGALDGLVGLVPDLGLGSFTTPSLSLRIDPSASAEYAPPAAAPPTDDGDDLPATGGGLAILGLATLGGALLLFRRRE